MLFLSWLLGKYTAPALLNYRAISAHSARCLPSSCYLNKPASTQGQVFECLPIVPHELLHSRRSQGSPVELDHAEIGIDGWSDIFDALDAHSLVPVYVKLLQLLPRPPRKDLHASWIDAGIS